MYILTGGQDDLLSIWSLPDRQIVARCQGHDSWVTTVAFDPWRCDDRNYRFGSVGDDCKLLLWDFSVGMLHRPRGVSRLFLNSALHFTFTQLDKRVARNVADDPSIHRLQQGQEAVFQHSLCHCKDTGQAVLSQQIA